MRFNNEYRYTNDGFGGNHHYVVRGRHAAIHFHVHERSKHDGSPLETHSGLETHYRQPPDYMKDDCPSHEDCGWLAGNPCWHDGTTLYAMEVIQPQWQEGLRNDHEGMFRLLEQEYKNRFCKEDTDANEEEGREEAQEG